MSRQLPEAWHDKDAPAVIPNAEGRITQIREYELITPLFGGGVEPQQADPLTIIRATEVRGQLRFWWRATRGGQFEGNLEKMKQAEDLLWGSTEHPSLVDVEVSGVDEEEIYPLIPEHRDQPPRDKNRNILQNLQNPKLARDMKGRSYFLARKDGKEELRELKGVGDPASIDSYIAFPLSKTSYTLNMGVQFRLVVGVPRKWSDEQQKSFPLSPSPGIELGAALWAWETFGGLGARTRRGCGAVSLVNTDRQVDSLNSSPLSSSADFPNWLERHTKRYVIGQQWPDHVPHLRDVVTWCKMISSYPTGIAAWRTLSKKLAAFRHQRPKLGNRPGRNRWPEQDEVRRLTGKRLRPRHEREISKVRKFPRAKFGLPIIFQYKREEQAPMQPADANGDPPGNNTLLLPSSDRFASPLILRPLRCGNEYLGIAVVLGGSDVPDDLILTTPGGTHKVSSKLQQADAQHIMQSNDRTPLLGSETNVLRAFLNYLEGK